MSRTLTYSQNVNGWTSFYSYQPERMIGMNNRFYSFNEGNLWVHNSDNVPRNSFYGEQYTSKVTGVINDDPSTVKTFKTFYLESTDSWDVTMFTDLGSGYIEKGWFSLKEGDYFAHIRRNSNDGAVDMRSAQGLGTPSSIDSANASAVLFTFSFSIDSMMSVGDMMYSQGVSGVDLVGGIVSKSGNTVTVDTTPGAIPDVSTFLLYIKDNVAESYGTTGYYLEYTIENDSTDFVEIFSIGSSLFKSYP